MGASEDMEDAWNGVQGGTGESGNKTNVPLSWRGVFARARTTLTGTLRKVPFNWPLKTSPQTFSTYDQVQATAEQVSWRYVDAHGLVWDQKSVNLVLIEWLLDGAPSPLSATKLTQYRANADVLRPWPQGFPGAFPGEPQQQYPPFPGS